MTEHTSRNEAKSTASLFSEVVGQVSGLVRKEVDLVRAEMSENVSRAMVAIGLIVGGVIFVLVALNVLSAALVAGLTNLGIEAGWSALIVGAIYLVIAIILVRKGTNDLKATSLAPTRAAQSVRRDALALKETLNGKR
jgi:uncharacterized membrane protein YqjE